MPAGMRCAAARTESAKAFQRGCAETLIGVAAMSLATPN
jgi:hypothetical protein